MKIKSNYITSRISSKKENLKQKSNWMKKKIWKLDEENQNSIPLKIVGEAKRKQIDNERNLGLS